MHPLTILVVCRANYCRSPLVEHLLRTAADRASLPWTVSSAGTHANPGLPCHPHSARVLVERGIDPSGFVTRLLAVEQIAAADLVLTAGPEQRQQVVALSAEAVPRTFPLLTFATWLSHDPDGPADGDLLAAALRGRSRSQPIPLPAQTLRDPLGRRIRWFRRCAAEIDQAVAVMVDRGCAGRGTADPANVGQLP
jgi:protein-tyrosine phosphatase